MIGLSKNIGIDDNEEYTEEIKRYTRDLGRTYSWTLKAVIKRPDKYRILRMHIKDFFEENKGCYGYRRIHALLKNVNITVSEKIVHKDI